MKRLSTKFKNETLDMVKTLSNDELIARTLNLAGGDDYDGCHTHKGSYEYEQLLNELNKRLKIYNFIIKNIFE